MVFIIKEIIKEMIKDHTIDAEGYWIIDDDKLSYLIFQKLENEDIYDIKRFVDTFGIFKAIEAYKEDNKIFIVKPNINDNYKELACFVLCSCIMKKSPEKSIEKDDTSKKKQSKKYAENKDKINEKRRAKYLNDKLKKQHKLIF